MQNHGVDKAGIYTDFSGLNALKAQAGTDRKAALEEVAKQFESLFLSEMLKSMRKAGDVFSEGNYLNSNESESYRDMFDNQLSLSMTRNQGTGLSEALVRQMSRQIPGMDSEGGKLAAHKATLADYDRSLPALKPSLPEHLQEVDKVIESLPEGRSKHSSLPARFDSPEQFVRELMPVAQQISEQSGINPRLMVAQAALETGWGRHMIEGEGGSPSYNLFGIKADQRWQGGAVDIATTEYREGVPMNERAAFRSYPDYQSSFSDYVDFLESNPRYREALNAADNPEEFAEHLQRAGYATDPDYAEKVRRIMNGDSMLTLSMGDSGAEE